MTLWNAPSTATMLEKLKAISIGLNRRFPNGDDPFQMITCLVEECGELATQVNLFEGSGVKREKYGEPDKAKLAKEVQDVLGCALLIAQHYEVEQELAASIERSYQRLRIEGLVEETASEGDLPAGLTEATLCFLIKGRPPVEILLGLKKAGFGAGKYAGFGGKIKAGETVPQAAVRELEEETGLHISEQALQRAGHLTFLFPAKPEWSQVVHVFLVRSWNGEPVESTEMKPTWFKTDKIPFERMWQDNAYWLPLVLENKRVRASFVFKDDSESVDKVEIEQW